MMNNSGNTRPTTLLELAERCEAATGPDRELDALIWCALNDIDPWQRVIDDFQQGQATRYTASLDAALTLVPNGHSWMVSVGGGSIAQVTDCTGDPCSEPPDYDGHAATPALALCAAALRAKASQ